MKNVKLCIPTRTILLISSSATMSTVMKHNINRFDTSNYAIDNAYDIPSKKVPSKKV